MRIIEANEIEAALDYPSLVERLRGAFQREAVCPLRHHYPLGGSSGEASLLLMPAWQPGSSLGVKVVTVFPENVQKGHPSVQGAYLLFDGASGAPLALCDGTILTRKRTGAASALAATYLARPDSARLLMVGTGALAPYLIAAHAAVRPIREVSIWGRRPERAVALAARLDATPIHVGAVSDLESAVGGADIVSCATFSREPLVRGEWLRPGTHLDLVGGFTPGMREADDEAVRRARVFVDTKQSATKEAGDIALPIALGVLREGDIADLLDLTRGLHPGRSSPEEITLFKSVGNSLEDLVAAQLALERSS